MSFFINFLISQLFTTLPIPHHDYTSQVVAITGSNTGLGLSAATHFLRLNASKVILCVRDTKKGEEAADYLCNTLSISRSRVQVLEVDLGDFESIRRFGKELRKEERLDVFVQNAGILTNVWEVDGEGVEKTVKVNVLGAAYVGALALQVLQRSSRTWGTKGRLVFVGSDLFLLAKFKERFAEGKLLKVLKREDGADMADRYKVSKLLLLFFVRDLVVKNPYFPPQAHRTDDKGARESIVINYITPGACGTSIFRDDVHWLQQAFINLAVRLIARTAEEGSRTILHAASPDVGRAEHGAFLMDCKVAGNGAFVESEEGVRMQRKFIKELYDEYGFLSQRLYESDGEDSLYTEAYKFRAD